jgi:anti-sigma factor RsiW
MNDSTMNHDQVRDLAAGYVLGALDPSEEAAVREHLATCPEPHTEFEELGGVVPYLLEPADLELVEPPASLRDRIMAAAAADLEARAQGAAPPPATAERTTPFPSADERAARAERTRARTGPLEWAMRIAAVLAVVALGAWNFQLQGRVSDLQQQVAAARQYQTAVAAVLEVSFESGSQTAVLKPQEADGPRGIAAVAPNGSIQFAVQDLAPTTGTQVYETWAIVGDQAPIPLGSFTVGPSGTASFTSGPGPAVPGVVVALSREPQAGATTPTEVVSVGAATTPSS